MTTSRARRLLIILVITFLLSLAALPTTAPRAAADPGAPTGPVVIDAQKDPNGAASALGKFNPERTDNVFEPTSTPAYFQGAFSLASDQAVATLKGKPPTTATIESEHTWTSSTSLSGTVEASVEVELGEFLKAEASAELTVGKEWSTTTGYAQDIGVTAAEGKMVTVWSSQSQVTFAGNWVFTGTDNVNYHVLNMVHTVPADGSGAEPGSDLTFLVLSNPITPGTTASAVKNGKITLTRAQQEALTRGVNQDARPAPRPRYEAARPGRLSQASTRGPLAADDTVDLWPRCWSTKDNTKRFMDGEPYTIGNRTPWTWTFNQIWSYAHQGNQQVTNSDGKPCWPSLPPTRDVVQPGQDVTIYLSQRGYADSNDYLDEVGTIFAYDDPGDGSGQGQQTHIVRAVTTNNWSDFGSLDLRDFLIPQKQPSTDIRGGNGSPELISLAAHRNVTIDGLKEPAQAAAAVRLFLDPSATDKSYIPSGSATFTSNADPKRTSARVINLNDSRADLGQTTLVGSGESTSMDWSVGAKVQAGLMDVANLSIGYKISGGHTWTEEVQNSVKISTEVEPATMGWIETSSSRASISGDFTFTAYNVTYTVKNVTLTEPGVADPTQPNSIVFKNNANDCKLTDAGCLPATMKLPPT
jgi:hypothetical protein